MTIAIKRFCAHQGCNALVLSGYCPAHKSSAMRSKNNNMLNGQEFYGGYKWKQLRSAHRKRQPLCQSCAKEGKVRAGTLVDHIIPIREGADPFDISNLQTLCDFHHQKKRSQESRNRK